MGKGAAPPCTPRALRDRGCTPADLPALCEPGGAVPQPPCPQSPPDHPALCEPRGHMLLRNKVGHFMFANFWRWAFGESRGGRGTERGGRR